MHINFLGLFKAKAIFVEQQLWYYLTNCWRDKRVHTFPKGISPKVNAISLLEFEPACSDVTFRHVNHSSEHESDCDTSCSRNLWNGPQRLGKRLEDLETRRRIETSQNTVFIRSAWILRRVLEIWGDLLSLRFLWKTTSWWGTHQE